VWLCWQSDSSAITVGINAVREICKRQPLGMEADLLADLVDHASHTDKSVVNAARRYD